MPVVLLWGAALQSFGQEHSVPFKVKFTLSVLAEPYLTPRHHADPGPSPSAPLPPLQCGACWAFATVAALESLLLIQHNQEHDLSEQQLIDCVSAAGGYGSMGCRGGWSTEGLNYVRNGNLTTEANYPFR